MSSTPKPPETPLNDQSLPKSSKKLTRPYKSQTHSKSSFLSSSCKSVKEHFLYIPFYPLPDLSHLVGELIEYRISSEYLSTSNKAFLTKRIWGSTIYTSDSDPVCILQHSGCIDIYTLDTSAMKGVSLYLRVNKGKAVYNSSFKHGIKSKMLSNYHGHSIKPEHFVMLDYLGNESELVEMANKIPFICEYERMKPIPKKIKDNLLCETCLMVFNLSYEMWLMYSLPAICEWKGLDKVKCGKEVLYVENEERRYEISVHSDNVNEGNNNNNKNNNKVSRFKLSEVKEPVYKDKDYMNRKGIPLPNEDVIDVYTLVEWSEFMWGEKELKVKSKLINGIKCFNYFVISNNCN